MTRMLQVALIVGGVAVSHEAFATGLATCNSGPPNGWQSQDVLKKKLTDGGWQIRQIKVDGGCYEVYAQNDKGQRGEFYFHPVTFEPVTSKIFR